MSDDGLQRMTDATLHQKSRDSTQWSTCTLAKELNLIRIAAQRPWRACGLKSHRTATFTLSRDPHFLEKVSDIVGLYMSPSQNTLDLCMDDEFRMQALDSSQPLLPTVGSEPERHIRTHVRHDTTSLPATLDTATENVIGKTYRRHRSGELLRFLNMTDSRAPSN